MKNISLLVFILISAILLCFVGWVNYINLVEAYGEGPPYYGRTTNMDKWSNPIPFLLTLNILSVGVLLALRKLYKKLRGKKL